MIRLDKSTGQKRVKIDFKGKRELYGRVSPALSKKFGNILRKCLKLVLSAHHVVHFLYMLSLLVKKKDTKHRFFV